MTTKEATDDVRAAVFGLLDGEVAAPYPFAPGNPDRLLPVVEEVGDSVAPYIEIGSAFETSDDSHDKRGAVVSLSVHTWSEYNGFAEVGRVHKRIKEILDKRSDVPGLDADWEDVYVRVTSQQSMRDETSHFRHGVTDVQVRLTQKED